MSQASNNLAAYCWSLADLLRGDFKQSQYGRIILPFTLLRRLECVLAPTKAAVLAEREELAKMNYPVESQERLLRRATGGLSFFNTSRMDLSNLSEKDVKDDLISYINAFSKDAREIFEYFDFGKFIADLDDANLLYRIVKRVAKTDLSPASVTNHDMGLVFEELIRRFAESSNETAGEHFTPRDIVRLTTSLVLAGDEHAFTQPGTILSVYDPTAGTGGFLSAAMEHVFAMNPGASLALFGQELNPESYAICKGDMLIKNQDVSRIKLGNTLSQDHLQDNHFDYMLSNPPFGVDWKKIEKEIKDEHTVKGFGGRFGPGLPRVSDGSLLFLLHLIAKMKRPEDGGSRIGIILNGSPLFTGGAGSGESEIRRYLLENDLLEAIIALPTDMFYNTGIATYIWILSNRKDPERKGKLQLINGVNLSTKMRKSLGSKRQEVNEADQAMIIHCFGDFAEVASQELDKPAEVKSNRGRQAGPAKQEAPKTFASKLFPNHAFGFRRLTIERPLRQSFQFSDERLAGLRFAPRPLDEPMAYLYETYGQDWRDHEDDGRYGDLREHQVAIRKVLKTQFPRLKEAKIKELLRRQTWLDQLTVLQNARQLQREMGTAQHDDMNGFDSLLKRACGALELKLDAKTRKQIQAAVSWKNPDAAKVVKKVHKAPANPFYGLFNENGKTVEYQADSELRDYENVALDPSQPVDAVNEAYVQREVLPHVPEAWIDGGKRDARDGAVGIVGYEIPFNRHFYVYQPPRSLAEIDADLDALSAEIMQLLREVHS